MLRYIVHADTEEEKKEVNKALDEKFIDYDFDSDDRYMVDEDEAEEFEAVLNELGIDFDEV